MTGWEGMVVGWGGDGRARWDMEMSLDWDQMTWSCESHKGYAYRFW